MISYNRNLSILGYSTTFFIALYATLKFQKLPGPREILLIAGLLLSIYYPLIFLKKFKNQTHQEPRIVHKFGAFLLGMLIISVVLHFHHWAIVSWGYEPVITYLKINPMIFNSTYFGFSLIFIPWLIYDNHQYNKQGLFINLIGGLGLAIFSIGLVGSQMHDLNWTYLISIGSLLFVLIYLPLRIRSLKNDYDKIDSTFQFLIPVYIITIFIYLIFYGLEPTNPDVF